MCPAQPKTKSELAAALREAMTIVDAQRANGVPLEEHLKGLDAVLRAKLTGTPEWKYLCDRCRDYGLAMHECPGDATCGWVKPHLPHEYGEPCWCAAGAKFRPKVTTPDDFQDAGKTPKKPTKVWQR